MRRKRAAFFGQEKLPNKKALVQCKKLLARYGGPGYIVHRSNAVTDRAVCFLGRFLPKLGGASAPPSFFVQSIGIAES
jgi:hypothetical protein